MGTNQEREGIMKILSSEELAKKIFKDYEGMSFIGYKFNIQNSPAIRVSNENPDYIRSCTCKFHSVKDISQKKDCRFTSAYRKAKEARLI